jgi:trans-aconitate 2-methyltransferase
VPGRTGRGDGPAAGDGGRPGSYAFGDTALASRRLDVLASVFGPTSRTLLGALPPAPRRVVLDLGCGPGHTTAMLADTFPEADVLGLDASEAFVTEATATAPARCGFRVADVTRRPLPGGPADLIYARFLVVHLPDPHAAVSAWAGRLAPGGVLVIEEPERIDTEDTDFRRYLELASVVVGVRGGDLYAGRLLAEAVPPSTAVVARRSTPLDVPTAQAATIFSLNLAAWRDDPAVAAAAGPGETADLAARLERRCSDTSTGLIRWWMCQLVLGPPTRKRGPSSPPGPVPRRRRR